MNSRDKGKRGEREFINYVESRTTLKLSRNLQQSDIGGSDILGFMDYAVEIKRRENLNIWQAWEQACKQAKTESKIPFLAFRRNNGKWIVCLTLDRFLELENERTNKAH